MLRTDIERPWYSSDCTFQTHSLPLVYFSLGSWYARETTRSAPFLITTVTCRAPEISVQEESECNIDSQTSWKCIDLTQSANGFWSTTNFGSVAVNHSISKQFNRNESFGNLVALNWNPLIKAIVIFLPRFKRAFSDAFASRVFCFNQSYLQPPHVCATQTTYC